jgi:hypothetical protein
MVVEEADFLEIDVLCFVLVLKERRERIWRKKLGRARKDL